MTLKVIFFSWTMACQMPERSKLSLNHVCFDMNTMLRLPEHSLYKSPYVNNTKESVHDFPRFRSKMTRKPVFQINRALSNAIKVQSNFKSYIFSYEYHINFSRELFSEITIWQQHQSVCPRNGSKMTWNCFSAERQHRKCYKGSNNV